MVFLSWSQLQCICSTSCRCRRRSSSISFSRWSLVCTSDLKFTRTHTGQLHYNVKVQLLLLRWNLTHQPKTYELWNHKSTSSGIARLTKVIHFHPSTGTPGISQSQLKLYECSCFPVYTQMQCACLQKQLRSTFDGFKSASVWEDDVFTANIISILSISISTLFKPVLNHVSEKTCVHGYKVLQVHGQCV